MMPRSAASLLLALAALASTPYIGRAGPIKPSATADRTSLQYGPGMSLQYAYTTGLSVSRRSLEGNAESPKPVGITVKSEVRITPVWRKDENVLLRLEVTTATAISANGADEGSSLKALTAQPAYFLWHQRGEVRRVFAASSDPAAAVNFKKGIISLLQLQTVDGERSEVDTSGECRVTYSVAGGSKLSKSKSDCKHPGDVAADDSSRMLGVRLDVKSHSSYELAEDLISSVDSSETFSLASRVNADHSRMSVTSRQILKLTGRTSTKATAGTSSIPSLASAADAVAAVKLLGKGLRTDFTEMPLSLNADSLRCTKYCNPVPILESINRSLKSSEESKPATAQSAASFLTLLPLLRQATKDDIITALQKSKSSEMLLIDAVAFTQTDASNVALMSHVDFSNGYDQVKAQRYLSAVSLTRRPHVTTVQSLLELYERSQLSPQLSESVGLALGATAAALLQSGSQQSLPVIGKVQSALSSSLSKCTDQPCRLSVLRAMRNSQLPGLVDTVLHTVENSSDMAITFEAVRAAGAIVGRQVAGSGAVTTESLKVCKGMNEVFHKRKRNYEGTIRAAAFDIILKFCRPGAQNLVNALLSTVNQTDFETSAFVQSRLADLANSDAYLRDHLDLLSKRHAVWNYNTRATGGNSSSVTNAIGKSGGSTLEYGLRMHNALNGIMKRTSFELLLSTGEGKEHSLPLVATDLYAHGLESLIGNSNAEATADSAPTESSGGMVLEISGVGLRPIEFFGRSSGLMSAVWNAPSTPVSALTMNALLQDYTCELHLQSGFILDATILGAVSLDLSGAITISLWNRDAHSDVFTRSAIVIRGNVELKANQLLSLGIGFENDMTTTLTLVTDVNFYNRPIKMCLQMGVDPYVVRQRWMLYENHRGRGKKQTTTLIKNSKYSGASYPLGSQISAQCRTLQAS